MQNVVRTSNSQVYARLAQSSRISIQLFFKVSNSFWLILIFFISFSLNTCGFDVEDPAPPAPPQWVQKSLPEIWPERGIDANETGGIYLEWEANAIEEAVATYRIYRASYFELSDSLGDFELLSTRTIASDPSCEFIDHTAVTGTKYHFVLKASDSDENTSEFSEELVYTLLPKLSSATMQPNGLSVPLPESRQLSWRNTYHAIMEDYCLTILDDENTFVLRQSFSPIDYSGNTETWDIPTEVALVSGNGYRWRIEMGAHYSDGVETAGSESDWARFLYTGQ